MLKILAVQSQTMAKCMFVLSLLRMMATAQRLMTMVVIRMVRFASVWPGEGGSLTMVVPFGRRVKFPRRMDMARSEWRAGVRERDWTKRLQVATYVGRFMIEDNPGT